MKELTSIEMNEISGAGILSFLNGEQSFGVALVDAVVGGIYGAVVQGGVWGAVIGAYEGTAAIDDRTRIFFDSVVFGTGGGFKN